MNRRKSRSVIFSVGLMTITLCVWPARVGSQTEPQAPSEPGSEQQSFQPVADCTETIIAKTALPMNRLVRRRLLKTGGS